MTRLIHELRITRTMNKLHLYQSYRPAILRVIGCALLPESITIAWYAQECPPQVDTTDITFVDRCRWNASRLMRGVSA